MSVLTTGTVAVGTAPPPALVSGPPHAVSIPTAASVPAINRGSTLADTDASGWIESAAGVPRRLDPGPQRATFHAGPQIGWQRVVAVCIRVRPVAQAMRAHALGKLDLHRDVGRGAGANGRRESVVDRLARLPRGRRRCRCALWEVRLAVAVDRGLRQVRQSMSPGAGDQLVPGLGRRFALGLTGQAAGRQRSD